MGIKQRLLFFWVVGLVGVLALFTAVTYFLVRHHLNNHVRDRVNNTLQELSHAVKVENGQIQILGSEALEDKKNGVRDTYWMVGTSGNTGVLQSIGNSPRWRRVGMYSAIQPKNLRVETINADDYLVDQRVLELGGQKVVLTAAYPLEENEHYLMALLAVMSAATLLAGLAAWLLGSWLITRALDPLTQLARQAEAIGEKDLSLRLQLASGAAQNDQIALLTQAFNACLARLETAFEQQRRFASSASHELRTPLTIIQGETEVALRRERPAAEYREVLGRIEKQSMHLLDLIEKLLFLGRGAGFENSVQGKPVKVGELVAAFQERWKQHARSADLSTRISNEVGEQMISVQPALFHAVLDNLMDNAAKYSTEKTPITLAVSNGSQAVLFELTDAGPGIPAQDLPRVFEPFYRGEKEQGTRGAGLGLATAQRIATLYGGSLQLHSPVDTATRTGTRAALRIPLAS